MQSHNKFILLASLLFTISISGCFDDEDIEGMTSSIPDPYEIVNTSVYGLVVDENDEPIEGKFITLYTGQESYRTRTDADGYYVFLNRDLPVRTHMKIGFENRNIDLVANTFNFNKIKIIENKLLGTLSGKDGGRINVDGFFLDVPPEAFVLREEPFLEDVEFYGRLVSPDDVSAQRDMIGDLSGISIQGDRQSLITAGMVDLSFRPVAPPSDNPITLAEGQNINLSILRQNESQNSIPQFWFYDEDLGTWVEQDQTVSSNADVFSANINIAGAWNFDYKGEVINISGEVRFLLNGEISNNLAGSYKVTMGNEDINRRGGYITSDGSFVFRNFPKDEPFDLTITDGCENTLFQSSYGPFSESQTLPQINIEQSDSGILPLHVTGIAKDCSGASLENGTLQIKLDQGRVFYKTIKTGEIDFALNVNCESDATARLIVVSADGLTQSNPKIIELKNGDIDVEEINLCDPSGEFFQLQIEDEPFENCLNPIVNLQGTANSNFGCGDNLFTISNLTAVGEYFNVLTSFFVNGKIYIHTDPEDFSVVISEFDDQVNGAIGGTFSGQVREALGGGTYGPNKNIEGTFRIIND